MFSKVLLGDEKELLELLGKIRTSASPGEERLAEVAEKLGIKKSQLIFALGFNRNKENLRSVFSLLGYDGTEALNDSRNVLYIQDVYKDISLDNILTFYGNVKNDGDLLQVISYLLRERLKNIETLIESTVNSLVIEQYKVEMRSAYADGIVDIDLAEERLSDVKSGFRALLNEVCVITESRVIPAGDIFFRDNILPEERRKLLSKNLIPLDLVKTRLEQTDISEDERRILQDYLTERGCQT